MIYKAIMEKFTIKTGAENMILSDVSALLKQTYWANTRADEIIQKSIDNSLCAGAFDERGRQRGFARAMSDFSTTYYLCDVVVDESFRGNGAGAALVDTLVNDPRIASLRGLLLTQTAAGLYEKFGFGEYPGECMTKARK